MLLKVSKVRSEALADAEKTDEGTTQASSRNS
jgi:hypothetical protein